MPFNIYSTGQLLAAIEGIDPADSFLRDRYFPSGAADVFATEKVLVEFRDGDRRLAPFVSPRKKGVTMLREGATMRDYMPPTVAPRRTITIDDVTKRGFGEAILGQYTPEQRAAALAMRDMEELDAMIARREEAMAVETMMTNGCVMHEVGDDVDNTVENEIRFYSENSNPSTYTIDHKWGTESAHVVDDLAAMADKLTSAGLPASDFVCAPDVAQAIVKDAAVQKLLDIRRYEMGQVAPSLTAPGAAIVCTLNVYGNEINVISYNQGYQNDKGKFTRYMASGTGVMTAPGAGRTLYGAVTQVEQEDGQLHAYAQKRVPKFVADAAGDVRTLTLTSKPLLVPNAKNPWVSATGILS